MKTIKASVSFQVAPKFQCSFTGKSLFTEGAFFIFAKNSWNVRFEYHQRNGAT